MSRVNDDAWNIRKLMREAEAVTDEALVSCARLKQAMILARQNPDIRVGAGQSEVLRLNRAEENITSAFSELLRVHAGLSNIARETAGTDENIPTDTGKDPEGALGSVAEAA